LQHPPCRHLPHRHPITSSHARCPAPTPYVARCRKEGSMPHRSSVASRPMRRSVLVLASALLATPAFAATSPSLLFHVDARHGLEAEVARGEAIPNFRDKVTVVDDAVQGKAIQWQDDGVLSWNAPGNILAQRGTLAFDWRPRYALGEAPFVVFRVGYADHSSWDMAWLRIDWNGHGFDAFVTDANLARTRVSFRMPDVPRPEQWLHL